MRRVCAFLAVASMLPAQEPPIAAERVGPAVIRDYRAPDVPPARAANAKALASLIRAGNLYLSLSDAIAFAIANNIDIEIARYGPLLADWAVTRAEAGGPIRGVPSGSAQVASVDSGLGVNGSTLAAGLLFNNNGNGGGNTGGATIQQIGQITPNLDPVITNTTSFSHLTQPLANTIASGTNDLVQSQHTYNTTYQQGLITGGIFQVIDYEQALKENSPLDVINPAVGPHMDLYLKHSLLQGFGIAMNDRFIRMAKLNVKGAREAFRAQLLDTTANVTELYDNLAGAIDELEARRQALAIAIKFRDDTAAQIRIGSLAPVELPRAEVELAQRREDLTIVEGNVRDAQIRLKAAISRTEDPAVEAATIVPLDRVEVPKNAELPPLRDLVKTAMEKRPDVAVARIRDETQAISSIGTENPLLPTSNITLHAFDRGSAGTYQPSSGAPPDPQFIGGYGTAAGQIFRRDFPSETGQLSFSAPFRNRGAQADYGIDQLQLRQSAITSRRDDNAIVVALSNELIAVRQARARYEAAVNTRDLERTLLTAEQQKFAAGKSSTTNLIIAQRGLVNANVAEVQARLEYARARISLDQLTGTLLETAHVNVGKALGNPQ